MSLTEKALAMDSLRRCEPVFRHKLVQVWNIAGEKIWPVGIGTRPAIRGHLPTHVVLGMQHWVKRDIMDPSKLVRVVQPVAFITLSSPAARLLPDDCLASRGLHLQALPGFVPEAASATDPAGPEVDLDSVDTPPTPPRGATRYGA